MIEGAGSVEYNARLAVIDNGIIKIGKGSTFNASLYMGCSGARILIGIDNMFSLDVKFIVGDHQLYMNDIDILNKNDIITRDHVWVGTGSVLLPKTDIGEGSVVGAASVVNSQIISNATCAGNPLRVLRKNIRWER